MEKKNNLYTRLLIAVIMMAMGSAVWADDGVVYTLETEKYSSYSYYNEYHDVNINDITWNAPGNMNFTSYWRIGGGKATTANRTITSKTPIEYAISQVTINHQGISNASFSVLSATLTIATEASFSTASIIETVKLTPTVSTTASSFSFTPQKVDIWPKGCYYKLTLSYKNTSTSNAGLNFTSMNFYGHEDEAETYTWTASSLGYTENTEVTTTTTNTDPINITFAKGRETDSYNNPLSAPTYSPSDAGYSKIVIFGRYNQVTMSAPEGYAISGILIHYQNSSRNLTPSIGTYVGKEYDGVGYGEGKWTGCSPHVTLTNETGVKLHLISFIISYITLQEVTTETVTVSNAGAATYCPTGEQSIVVGDGTFTNIITGVKDGVVTEENIPIVPTGTGVMLHGEGTYKCYTDSRLSTPTIATNYLVGVTSEGSVPLGSYALQNQEGEGLGFYPVQTAGYTPIDAGKAYLTLPDELKANLRPLFFTQEDADRNATAIQPTHFDGQSATTLYNLNGLQLKTPQKGINIIRKADGTIRKVVTP